MPGADTWSAKEYKGHVYAGDMTRGFDTLPIEGPRATLTGRATVDGVTGVHFVLDIEDLGKANAGADTFRLVTGTGYAAFGVVERGNVTVSGSGLLGP